MICGSLPSTKKRPNFIYQPFFRQNFIKFGVLLEYTEEQQVLGNSAIIFTVSVSYGKY